MTTYEVPARVKENQARRAACDAQQRVCGDGIGDGRTCGAAATHLFARGWRCDEHAPPAVMPDPTRTLDALRTAARINLDQRPAGDTILDQRNHDSGRAVSRARRAAARGDA